MDGAGKFVSGDVNAGMFIMLLINIIGGILHRRVAERHELDGSRPTFSLLTIGDGLVATIPSLITSTGSPASSSAGPPPKRAWARNSSAS
jgi:flagellar biosynthesis protein FlhA